MSSPQAATETVCICIDCGYQQSVTLGRDGRPRTCQNCGSELSFEKAVTCPHCMKNVVWSAELSRCALCRGVFAPGIPLRPKQAHWLSIGRTGATDAFRVKQLEHKERDIQRRSEELYRSWASASRGEGSATEGAETSVRSQGERPAKRLRPLYGRGVKWAGLAAVLIVIAWAGVTLWGSATKQTIQGRFNELSHATLRADGAAVGRFYGATLLRFQNGYDVPHEKAVLAVGQLFRDYPFVIRFEYKNPVFESVSIGEVSTFVDQDWELRGNEIYSGSERHRLIWRKESGEWRIVSQELIKTYWSRRTPFRTDASNGSMAIGVSQ